MVISSCWLATVWTWQRLYRDQSSAFPGLTDENRRGLPHAGEWISALVTSGNGKLKPWRTSRSNTECAHVPDCLKWTSCLCQKCAACLRDAAWKQRTCKASFCGLSLHCVRVSESQSVGVTIFLPQWDKVRHWPVRVYDICEWTVRWMLWFPQYTVKVRDIAIIWLRTHPTSAVSCITSGLRSGRMISATQKSIQVGRSDSMLFHSLPPNLPGYSVF